MHKPSADIAPIHRGLDARERKSRELLVEWFNLHRRELTRYANRILPELESAEDLVQDVFVRVLRMEDATALHNPRAFLMAAARNAAIDRLRKLGKQPEVESAEELPQQQHQEWGSADMMIAIERALHELPARTRQVFVLRRFKGLESATVAAELGISTRMVQKHMVRAMSHFQNRLGLKDRIPSK